MKILKQQKQLLCDFWDYFSENKEATGNRSRREALKYSYRTKEEKLQKLIEYSKINLSFSNQKSMSNRRIDFNYQKHTLVKMNIGIHLLCFVCNGKSECRHHIISIKNGGLNSKKNLVPLCNRCHSRIHPWMNH